MLNLIVLLLIVLWLAGLAGLTGAYALMGPLMGIAFLIFAVRRMRDKHLPNTH